MSSALYFLEVMSVRVTTVRPTCVESLCLAFDAVARERRFFLATRAPSLEELHRVVEGAIARKLPFFVATEEGRVMGWSAIDTVESEARRHCGVLGMGVLESHRGRGIGSRLLKRAVAHAFEGGRISRIQLEVFQDNTAAIAFYAGFGFHIEGVAKRAFRLRGTYKDVIQMALLK